MAEKWPTVTKDSFDGSKVEILGETYEPGKPSPEAPGLWRNKLQDRKQMLKYLETGLRYWYAKEGYGSEKRKNPA
jgi:hypothetical protein